MTMHHTATSSNKTLVICLYGLIRNSRITSAYFLKNILKPLQLEGYKITIIGHFNSPGMINSAHSAEFGIKEQSIPNYNLDYCWKEPQLEENIEDIKNIVFGLPWYKEPDPNGNKSHGFINQLHSMRRLYEFIDRFNITSDAFLLLRPDLLYLDKIDVLSINAVLSRQIDLIVPGWEEWGGLNDRFCICNTKTAQILLNRQQYLKEFCGKYNYIHAEHFLRYVVERNYISFTKTSMRAARIRSNGYILKENYDIHPLKEITLRLKSKYNKLVHKLITS